MVVDHVFFSDSDDDEDRNYDEHIAKFSKDAKDIKKFMVISQEYSGTWVIAVVIGIKGNYEENRLLEIPHVNGKTISHEVYNYVRDSYQVFAVDFCDLGLIPINYSAIIPDISWNVDLPLPLSVIKRYMSAEQKRSFTSWQSRFKENYEIKFIQSIATDDMD